jgi:hypothetical protein
MRLAPSLIKEDSSRERSGTTGMATRLFKLRKAPQARKVRGGFSMAVERNPCQVLDLQFERLEKARAVPFQESNRNAIAIKHAVASERRELRSRGKNASEAFQSVREAAPYGIELRDVAPLLLPFERKCCGASGFISLYRGPSGSE